MDNDLCGYYDQIKPFIAPAYIQLIVKYKKEMRFSLSGNCGLVHPFDLIGHRRMRLLFKNKSFTIGVTVVLISNN